MRGRSPSRLIFAVAIAAAAVGAGGCPRSDSILLVEVGGDFALQPFRFEVSVSIGNRVKYLTVPPEPTPIVLPASFSVELDRNLTGPVTIGVNAFDEPGNFIGSGSTTQQHIQAGGDTIIVVTLESTLPSLDEGGINSAAGGPAAGDP